MSNGDLNTFKLMFLQKIVRKYISRNQFSLSLHQCLIQQQRNLLLWFRRGSSSALLFQPESALITEGAEVRRGVLKTEKEKREKEQVRAEQIKQQRIGSVEVESMAECVEANQLSHQLILAQAPNQLIFCTDCEPSSTSCGPARADTMPGDALQ